MYDLLKAKNTGLTKDLISFTQDLIRMPSPSLKESDVAERVENEMRKVDYPEVFRDSAGNVVAVQRGIQSEPTILLASHMDTIEPTQRKNWNKSPWSGDISDGRLYGVGAADCKGGLAAQIYAGRLLSRAMLPFRGTLVVAATVAEENGCSIGLRTLLDRTLPELELDPIMAVLGEPTGLEVFYGHAGWFELDIRVEAENETQTSSAAQAIHRELMHSGVFSAQASAPDSVLIQHEPVVAMHGGHQENLHFARRLSPVEQADSVASEIRRTAARAVQSIGSVNVEVDVVEKTRQLYNGTTRVVRHISNAWETDPFNPAMRRALDALRAGGCNYKPGKWKLDRLGMGTGGSVLVNEFNIPTIGYGPGSEEQAHRVNESVSLSQLSEAVYGTAVMIYSLIGVPVCGWTSDFD